ncbi:hypothetical protein D3C80_1109760 [compost metagenome]
MLIFFIIAADQFHQLLLGFLCIVAETEVAGLGFPVLILGGIIPGKGNRNISYRKGQLPAYFVVLVILHGVWLLLVGPVARYTDVTGNAAVFLFSFQDFAKLVLQ